MIGIFSVVLERERCSLDMDALYMSSWPIILGDLIIFLEFLESYDLYKFIIMLHCLLCAVFHRPLFSSFKDKNPLI